MDANPGEDADESARKVEMRIVMLSGLCALAFAAVLAALTPMTFGQAVISVPSFAVGLACVGVDEGGCYSVLAFLADVLAAFLLFLLFGWTWWSSAIIGGLVLGAVIAGAGYWAY